MRESSVKHICLVYKITVFDDPSLTQTHQANSETTQIAISPASRAARIAASSRFPCFSSAASQPFL
jgi:hypothetical protein